ncbi:hypothetical protein [Oceanicella sp. SM1341]|uniref:hypothetical protein n=1 Tax=Oceanicella sp. SM1341 TaxID=1548889 RepID=UPI000E50A313|nr:hypothetical protein [Oceanicella sp. SM1341]
MRLGEYSAQVSQLLHEAAMHDHNGDRDLAGRVLQEAERLAINGQHAAATEHDTLTRMRAEIAVKRADLRAPA